jgi:outer membrane protein TolC
LTLQEALESTLNLHPQARIGEQQVAASRGLLREASGIFDPAYSSGVGQSFNPIPLTTMQANGGPTSAALNVTSLSAGASRLYANGISAGPVFEMDRARDRLANAVGVNRSRIAYELTIPLLRNRGPEAVRARIRSAGSQVDASRLDLNQIFSDLLTETAISYWALVGARRLLDVAAGSEARAQLFLENVEDLIKADRIPRNDLHQVRANLADRIAGRIAASQQVIVAKQRLALALGLPPEAVATIPDPAEGLPEGTVTPEEGPEAVRHYIELALVERADYLAARKRSDVERAFLAQAKNALLPNVELTLSSGYSGLSEGVYPQSLLAAPFRGVRGVDAVAGVRYHFSPRNNVAGGRLAQTEAAIQQADWRTAAVARQIASEVVVAVAGVSNATLRLAKAKESVAAFQDALDGEREKYRRGFGSLVDILTIEERLTGALAVAVQAQLDAAVELAHLRQATGTLVPPEATAPRADRLLFLTLPDWRKPGP